MSDNTTVDAPWPELQRVPRAIVVVDVVESVRLMQLDEAGFIDRWRRFVREVVTDLLPAHGGRLVKSLGDGMLLAFEQPRPAAAAALKLPGLLACHRIAGQCIQLRVGAHMADVVEDEHDVFGSGVNIAARLAGAASPGDILVTAAFRDRLIPGLDADAEDLGLLHLKHLDSAVRAFRIGEAVSPTAGAPVRRPQPLSPVVAVVPLLPSLPGAPLDALGDVLADEMIAQLSRSSALTVISRLSTAAFRERANETALMRDHLRADYAVRGRLHVSGDRLRLVLNLAELSSGQIVWSEQGGGSLRAVLAGDDPLVPELMRQVCHALVRRQVALVKSRTMHSLDSYRLLMAGIVLLHSNERSEFERARVLLEHLVDRDRRHPGPHAWLAKWHVLKVQQGWADDLGRARTDAQHCARQALDLDPASSMALAIDGFVHCNLLKDLDTAHRRYDTALAENPNEPLAWLFLGTLHAFRGEGLQAMEATGQALTLSPLDPVRYFFESLHATAALAAGRYEESIKYAERSLRLNGRHTSTLRAMAISQVQLGRMDDARASVRSLLSLEPTLTVRDYLQRTPSAGFSTGDLWSQSLLAAGVPAG